MGAVSLPEVNCGRGVLLTTHPLLVTRSWKIRAIPLPPLWAVGPVQSLSACTRVHLYTYTWENIFNTSSTVGTFKTVTTLFMKAPPFYSNMQPNEHQTCLAYAVWYCAYISLFPVPSTAHFSIHTHTHTHFSTSAATDSSALQSVHFHSFNVQLQWSTKAQVGHLTHRSAVNGSRNGAVSVGFS